MTWCRPGMTHRYDRHSGWCANCGRVREDGREVNRWGTQMNPGPTYTPEELLDMKNRMSR